MRLIDADALDLDREVELADDWKTAHEIANVVKYAPTVDAAPVVHGKWISAGDFEACSVCGATHLKTINTYYGKATKLWVKTNYCPNCGAKMDLEGLDDHR